MALDWAFDPRTGGNRLRVDGTGAGSEVVIDGFGTEETVFGATILTVILTFEDPMLTIEPVRRGAPEIGVGNVIGSVLFSVTGNVGVIKFISD